MSHNLKREKMPYTGKKEIMHELDCVAGGKWGISCSGKSDDTHLAKGSHAGWNCKNDRRTLPQCRAHHTLQGTMPEETYWKEVFRFGIQDAFNLADFLHILFLELQLYPESIEIRDFEEACERFAV